MRLFNKCCGTHSECRPTSRAGRILHFGGHAILGLGVAGGVAVVFGWATMTAWNVVIPATFNLPLLTFWQAVGLLVLGRILTARFHHPHRGRYGTRQHGDGNKCCFFSCSPHPDDTAPPHGDSYSQWWWEEGQALFKAFQSRKTDTDKAPTP